MPVKCALFENNITADPKDAAASNCGSDASTLF